MHKLIINSLTKTYSNGVKALDNVSLEIENGMFGLLGPNGAGKSSLMRTLATLQEADSGTATLNDIDILNQPKELRKNLGYLPQEFGVYPRITAEQLLNHMAVLKGITNSRERKELVKYLLDKVNLYDKRNKNVKGFSGGMKQRVGIAQALIGNPNLIIVDEPTAGLDPLERQRFLDILSRAGDNKIIILSTHIIEDVRDLCTDMGVMGEGKLIVRGAPEDLIKNIKGQVWIKQIDNDQEVEKLKIEMQVLSTRRLRGATVVTVLNPSKPNKSWKSKDILLEDAYFAYLNGFMSNKD